VPSEHLIDGAGISLCFALSGSRFAPSLAKEGKVPLLKLAVPRLRR